MLIKTEVRGGFQWNIREGGGEFHSGLHHRHCYKITEKKLKVKTTHFG